MVVFDYAARYGEAARDLAGVARRGRSSSHARTSSRASTTFPKRCSMLFTGENTGKLVLKVARCVNKAAAPVGKGCHLKGGNGS